MQTHWAQGCFTITTERSAQDARVIQEFLTTTYWATDRSLETVIQLINNSLCFGLFTETNKQIGFTRVLSDYASVSYVFDVYVVPAYRGLGLGSWLMQTVIDHPQLAQTNMVLATKDKHSFYEHFGFVPHPSPDRIMVFNRQKFKS